MEQFMKIFDKGSEHRELTLQIQFIRRGIKRWRITVCESGTAWAGGDKEFLTVENEDREQCFKIACDKLQQVLEREVA